MNFYMFRSLRRSKEAFGPLENGVKNVCEPLCGCWELNPRPPGRAASTLTQAAISSAPLSCCLRQGFSLRLKLNGFAGLTD